MQVKDKWVSDGFRDYGEMYVFSYPERCKSYLTEYTAKRKGWTSFPMTETEYHDYIISCCGWATEKYNFFSDYELTANSCTGQWYYDGYLGTENERAEPMLRYLGLHKMILNVGSENLLIYIYVDT